MMYPRSEILFPHRCVSALRRMRGPEWQELVNQIAALPDTHEDSLSRVIGQEINHRLEYVRVKPHIIHVISTVMNGKPVFIMSAADVKRTYTDLQLIIQ